MRYYEAVAAELIEDWLGIRAEVEDAASRYADQHGHELCPSFDVDDLLAALDYIETVVRARAKAITTKVPA